MRILSALAFVISLIGLLLAFYLVFGLVPSLHKLNQAGVREYPLTLVQRKNLSQEVEFFSMICLILGVFSILFCSQLYLRKKTRMTFLGILIGFLVVVAGIVYSWF